MRIAGRAALERIAETGGPERLCVPVLLSGQRFTSTQFRSWPLSSERGGGETVGHVTSVAWSPGLEQNIGLAVIKTEYAQAGTDMWTQVQDWGGDIRQASVTTVPMPGSSVNSRGSTR